MKQVLVTVSRGIIAQTVFFDNVSGAIRSLSKCVSEMNIEHEDVALYDSKGLIANAKHFLDDQDEYFKNEELIRGVSDEKDKETIYIIGNPKHTLGFMMASPDDPLGYKDPVEALSDLGQMRQDHGNHLKLYRLFPVDAPVAEKSDLEKHNTDCEVVDFNYSLIAEYCS
jgi:hypothetical protein